MKTIEQVLRNGNSTKNQQIKGQFIGREVYCNVGTLVEYCLSTSNEAENPPFGYDDIENLYTYPEFKGIHVRFEGGTDEQRQEEIERLRELLEEIGTGEDETLSENSIQQFEDEISELENLESEPQEIYEWWAVSEFMYRKLKEKGQAVLDAGSCYVWGRATAGQAILLDYVITEICADMGILEGQENAWA